MKAEPVAVALLLVATGGCAGVAPVYGLRPTSPEIRRMGPSLAPGKEHPFYFQALVFETIDSLQPVLAWEAFPRADDPARARIRKVTYELRIWRSARPRPTRTSLTAGGGIEESYPLDLVYERRGLPAPSNTVEAPLEPCTAYLRSIRARFELDGQPRATEWGRAAKYPDFPRRADLVPNPNYYRFRTPGCETHSKSPP